MTSPRPALTLSGSPRLRLLTMCVLYLAQGIPWGFVTVTLVAYLGNQDVSTDDIGNLVAYSTLPWAFKFIWGPIIDRFGWPSMGRRRPWILIAQTLMALTILAMVIVDDVTTGVLLITGMVFIHNCFNSLQDVAVDALAVDLLADNERGRVNGAMWASKYLGTLIGGAGIGTVMGYAGLRTALLVQAVILLVIMMVPLWIREHAGERLFPWSPGEARASETPAASKGQTRELLWQLWRAFQPRSARVAVLYGLLALVVPSICATLLNVLCTKQLHWEPAEVAQIAGGVAVIAGVLAALAGGFLSDWLGVRRTIALGVLLSAAVYVAFGLNEVYWHYRPVVIAMMVVLAALQSAVQVGQFSLFMGVSKPIVAATQFTAYMTILNVSMVVGQKCVGAVERHLGYANALVVLGLAYATTVILLLWIEPTRDNRSEEAAA